MISMTHAVFDQWLLVALICHYFLFSSSLLLVVRDWGLRTMIKCVFPLKALISEMTDFNKNNINNTNNNNNNQLELFSYHNYCFCNAEFGDINESIYNSNIITECISYTIGNL